MARDTQAWFELIKNKGIEVTVFLNEVCWLSLFGQQGDEKFYAAINLLNLFF
jgi:uncharacterized glyoxalase superfamily protein PhnB